MALTPDHGKARRRIRRLTRLVSLLRVGVAVGIDIGRMFVVAGAAVTRAEVEDFLFAEADLLDSWQLKEWLALFDEERGGFYIPSMDARDSSHTETLYLIADNMTRLRSRVGQLL